MNKTETHYSKLTDLQLVELHQSDEDKAVVGELFKRYMSLVYGVCLKYLSDRETSKDMTMQVFEKLLKDLKSKEIRNFKSWLYVVTKNECLMALRKRKGENQDKIKIDDIMEFELPLHHKDEGDFMTDNLKHMNSCLERLKEEQNSCIKLFYLQRKTYQEVASETGLDLGKVKSHLQNGRRNLKLCIEKLRE